MLSIAAMRLYVDGQLKIRSPGKPVFNSTAAVHTQATTESRLLHGTTAYVFRNTRILHSVYTYGYFDCPPKGNDHCTPGLVPMESFLNKILTLTTLHNHGEYSSVPPIIAMKAYVDNVLSPRRSRR
jgi:hypothetical protein